MPYRIVPLGNGRYKVVNALTGEVHSKRTTKARAERQVRLMNATEHGWRPTHK